LSTYYIALVVKFVTQRSDSDTDPSTYMGACGISFPALFFCLLLFVNFLELCFYQQALFTKLLLIYINISKTPASY